MFEAKNLNIQWTEGEVPDKIYRSNDYSWMDVCYLENGLKAFLCYDGSSCPLLLSIIGHSSHYNLEAVEIAKENGIVVFILVPHTTHQMQPLDTALYAPLKTNWQDVCHQYLQSHPGKVITKYQFNQVVSEAWLKMIILANIISGFSSCGVATYVGISS